MILAREMTASDRRFVVPTWVRGSHYAVPMSRRWRLVDRMLDEERVRVVVLATNDLAVHGWAAGSEGVLHFAYVPPELRGAGLAARAIATLLGEYPGEIRTSHPWPYDTERFRLSKRAERRVYALAQEEAA